MDPEFVRRWLQIREQVFAFCLRVSRGNDHLAEEVFQQTAIRAFRGYPSLREEHLFLPWVQTIARNEHARCVLASSRHRAEPLPESLAAPPVAPVAGLDGESPASVWMATATQAAVASGELADVEAHLLMVRATDPELTWEQIGVPLGLKGNACAVRHFRAIGKLRVFLFLHRQDLLGGRVIVADAFDAALADTEPLTADEAAVFRSLVLEGNQGLRKPGWYDELCAACGRVIRHVPLP